MKTYKLLRLSETGLNIFKQCVEHLKINLENEEKITTKAAEDLGKK